MDADTKHARLRAKRAALTLDEAVAAYRAQYGKRGVSRGSLARWETGDSWPSLDILKGLCDVYGCDVADIDPESAERIAALFPNVEASTE